MKKDKMKLQGVVEMLFEGAMVSWVYVCQN